MTSSGQQGEKGEDHPEGDAKSDERERHRLTGHPGTEYKSPGGDIREIRKLVDRDFALAFVQS
jgi:hypothetical protein